MKKWASQLKKKHQNISSFLVSRREIYCNRLYDEMARKVIIEHEMERQPSGVRVSAYADHYRLGTDSYTSVIGKHDAFPLYKINDAVTFWSAQRGTRLTTMRKNTQFSKPIYEQLDTQFH